MEAVDTCNEFMRSFLDAPEARNLIVIHNLSCADIALLMMVSCFEISGFTFSIILEKKQKKTGFHVARRKHNITTLKQY